MNGNFKGMDPELAKAAMNKIKQIKELIATESSLAASATNEKLTGAFAGSQTGAMQSFVDSINAALQGLYNRLDGSDSNFANKLNEIILSYEVSDENIKRSFLSGSNASTGTAFRSGSNASTGTAFRSGSNVSTGTAFRSGSNVSTGTAFRSGSNAGTGIFFRSGSNVSSGTLTPEQIYEKSQQLYEKGKDNFFDRNGITVDEIYNDLTEKYLGK